MLKTLYLLFALLVVGGYSYAGWRGLEFRQTKKGMTTQRAGVRGATGGGAYYYRGYRGGK
jgi:hypothetical protein